MNHFGRTVFCATAILVSLACQPAPRACAAIHDISMTADGYVPAYLEVVVGDTVRWWNDDYDFYDYHSTRSYSYPWSSGPVAVGAGVALLTTKTGTYDYLDDWGFIGSGTLVIKPAGQGGGDFISAPGRVDMVFDQPRGVLYITSGGDVLRYQLATTSFLPPFSLGGNLKGIDLSPEGKYLVVADASSTTTNVWVHVIDLVTEQSRKATFPIAFGESGTYAVAFGGDGAALITSRYAGSGWVPLRRYDPASNTTTTVSGGIRLDSMVSSSGDGTTIVIAESDISSGPFSRYDVGQRAITKTGGTARFNYECAASRDASLFALPTYGGTFIYDGNFNRVTNIGVSAGSQPIGAAFHPSADAVFFPFSGTTYVRAYSTTNWAMLAEYNFQHTFTTTGNKAFDNGRIRISPDGETIFVTVSGGVRYLKHNLGLPQSHRLVIQGNPANYGTPTPMAYGTYWLPRETFVTISVPTVVETNGTKMICTGWTGTGSALGGTTDPTTSFTLMDNTIITFQWVPFAITGSVQSQGGSKEIVLNWPSLPGKSYDVLSASSPAGTFTPIATDLPATSPTNSYQTPIQTPGAQFFKVLMK